MAPLYSGSADDWSYVSHDISASPIRIVDFVIDNFEAEMKKANQKLRSRPFSVKHSLWHIQVHPTSKDKETGSTSFVGVYIQNDNDVEMVVDCKFASGESVRTLVNKVIKPKNGHGYTKFLSHEACKELLIDGKFRVNIEMKIIQEEETVICGGVSSNSTTEMYIVNSKIFNQMSFPDFEVICNGKVFPCHRAFLATRSSVFKNMLEAKMKEAKDGRVEILNHSEIVVEHFVKFFYTNYVQDEVLKDHAVNFFDLGEQYQIEGLKKIAEQAMIANLSTENMLNYLNAGDMYQGGEVKEAAKAFIRKNRRSLTEQEGWRDAVMDRDLMLDLIESLSKD